MAALRRKFQEILIDSVDNFMQGSSNLQTTQHQRVQAQVYDLAHRIRRERPCSLRTTASATVAMRLQTS
jgi:hypothetical protein